MGPAAARKAALIVANVRRILAIELLAACDALDLRAPLASSPPLMAAHAAVRRVVAPRDGDRVLSGDIEAIADEVRAGAIVQAAENVRGPLE
jgi:histidine ammonia-lyase